MTSAPQDVHYLTITELASLLRARVFSPVEVTRLAKRRHRADRRQADLGTGQPLRSLPAGPSMDHVGPIARSAEDAGAVLAAIAGPDDNDPTSRLAPHPEAADEFDIATSRIGVDPAWNHDGADARTRPSPPGGAGGGDR
jgi:Amidase